MKKRKPTAVLTAALIILIILIITIITGVMPVNAAGDSAETDKTVAAAKFVETDTATLGNWVGIYGSDGYEIISGDNSLQKIPPYAQITYANETGATPDFWLWWNSDGKSDKDYTPDQLAQSEPGALFTDSAKTSRIAACYYNTDFFTVTVDVGNAAKTVSFYMLDYDAQSREADVYITDENGNDLIDPVYVNDYTEGQYLKFVISGKVKFAFESLAGPNVVLSGVFFDPAGSVSAAELQTAVPAQTDASPSAADSSDSANSASDGLAKGVGATSATTALVMTVTALLVALLAVLMIMKIRTNIPA